jgi:uncharacterized membrane protein
VGATAAHVPPGPMDRRPGVLQQLDFVRLVEAAAQADAVVAFRVGVGDTLHEGSHLVDIHGGDLPLIRAQQVCETTHVAAADVYHRRGERDE